MGTTNQGQKGHRYDADFKSELVRMLLAGKSITELSKTFGIGTNVLYTWKKKYTMKQKAKPNSVEKLEEASDFTLRLIKENEGLKKQVQGLEEEADILKKALKLFSKSD